MSPFWFVSHSEFWEGVYIVGNFFPFCFPCARPHAYMLFPHVLYRCRPFVRQAYHAQHGNLLLTHKYHVTPSSQPFQEAGGRRDGGGREAAAPTAPAAAAAAAAAVATAAPVVLVEHRGWRLGQKVRPQEESTSVALI